MPPQPRDHALLRIDRAKLPGWKPDCFAGVRPARLLDPRDIDLAERIEFGVIAHQFTLRWLISVHSGRSLRSVDDAVQKILCVALYQLRHLDRIHEAVIADEAVEQTHRMKLGRASGFVNAVLRKAASARREPIDTTGLAPAEAAERLHSIPRDVMARFIRLAGHDRAVRLSEGLNRIAPLTARLSAERTIDELRALGIDAMPHSLPRMVVMKGARADQIARAANLRIAQVMDPTSAAVVDHLDLKPGDRVLDRCCGRGTKTMMLAERIGPSGRIVATDSSVERVASLQATIDRTGILHVSARVTDTIKSLSSETFDWVLIDAPCSNSGVLCRRPAARYRQTEAHVASLARLQETILRDTLPALAPGGKLVYATCSVWPEENEQRIEAFAAEAGLVVEWTKTTWPNPTADDVNWHDGGFVALLRHPG
jgi:16S rRNA (cytosine967-C5)-methyltransferase